MSTFSLKKSQTALLIVDIQEKILASNGYNPKFLAAAIKMIRGFQILQLPILISEQYPQGLGVTIEPIKKILGTDYHPWHKTTFSCLDEPNFFEHLQSLPIQQWVIIGLEAHICILQTAKSLIQIGKEAIVPQDAIFSKSSEDFFIAINEMQHADVRISSVETILFELLKDAKAPEFKAISQLVKTSCQDTTC